MMRTFFFATLYEFLNISIILLKRVRMFVGGAPNVCECDSCMKPGSQGIYSSFTKILRQPVEYAEWQRQMTQNSPDSDSIEWEFSLVNICLERIPFRSGEGRIPLTKFHLQKKCFHYIYRQVCHYQEHKRVSTSFTFCEILSIYYFIHLLLFIMNYFRSLPCDPSELEHLLNPSIIIGVWIMTWTM